MNQPNGLSDMTQFELADIAAAARLAQHLKSRWAVCVHAGDERAVVSAVLRREAGDLAFLLRTVERWVADESLGGIRFELDGRDYLLAGEEPNRATPAAAA
jgi:hypothetical protein